MNTYTVEHLISTSQEVTKGDPIDWFSYPDIDKDSLYNTVALSVMEEIGSIENDKELIMASSIVHLVVENFLLRHAYMLESLKNEENPYDGTH